jgi:hypothetical protein
MNSLKAVVVTCSNTLRSHIYYVVENKTLSPMTYYVKDTDIKGRNKTFDTFTCEPLSTYVSKDYYPPVTVSHATDEDIKKAKTT